MNLFAAGDLHLEITQNTLFTIWGWPITNTWLYGVICAVFIIVGLRLIARRVTIHPKGGIIQVVEFIAEFIRNLVEGAFDDKKKASKYVPYFLSLFVLFLFVNWLGLLPFTRDALTYHGNPLLKPFTADLNFTFAAAVFTMIFVYISSIREAGSFGKYMRHFFVGSPKNPLFLFVGLLEMMSDLFRMISLSLRLFLNVAVGEMIIAVFQWLGDLGGPLLGAPIWLFDLFDVTLQAFIFVILSIMYLAVAVNHSGETDEEFLEKEVLPDLKTSGKMEGEAA
jgi:F-type H+-transporting ATPase subunit a